MKNFNLSHFLGCCVISVGIIIAGWLIGNGLPGTTQVPSILSVITQEQDEMYGKYLSKYQVAPYLGISEDDVDKLLKSGDLEGTYTEAGENHIFSREKLDEWVEKRIG